MTNQEFSIEFDILYNNISSNKAPGITEYEKSVFLTKAQEGIITELYSGRSGTQNSFEETEEQRRYLNNLVATTKCIQYDKLSSVNNLIDCINETVVTPYSSIFYKEAEIYNEDGIILYVTTKVDIFYLSRQNGDTIEPVSTDIIDDGIASKIYYKIPKEILYNREEMVFTCKLPNMPFPEKVSISIPISKYIEVDAINSNSYLFLIPSDVMFITYEYAILNTSKNGNILKEVNVYPVSQDDLTKILKNPFRGVSDNRVLRLDNNLTIEILSKYKVDSYVIRYIKKPKPIILTSLKNDGLSINGLDGESSCELDSSLHRVILDRAVTLALQTMYSK